MEHTKIDDNTIETTTINKQRISKDNLLEKKKHFEEELIKIKEMLDLFK